MTGPAALRSVTADPKWLESVLDQTSENRDQLPILQHLLRQMWNREDRGSAIGKLASSCRWFAGAEHACRCRV